MKFSIIATALALAGCMTTPDEPRTITISCGTLDLEAPEDYDDPIPPPPADTFAVKDGECRRVD